MSESDTGIINRLNDNRDALRRGAELILKKANLNQMTELTERKIEVLTEVTELDDYAWEEWGVKLGLKKVFVTLYMDLKVSDKRKGRTGIEKVLSSAREKLELREEVGERAKF